MARRKKKKRPSQDQKTRKNEPEIFNPAFDGLPLLEREKPEKAQKPDRPKPPEPRKTPDETRVFLEAMSNVKPLNSSSNIIARSPNVNLRPAHPASDDELEAMAHLSDLVSGAAEMDITFSGTW
jgi:hypothetical protein